jgi:rod shape-determining protein MreB
LCARIRFIVAENCYFPGQILPAQHNHVHVPSLDLETIADAACVDLFEGVPRTITIQDSEIREALSECVATILNAIRVALEQTPPELSADISDRGIVLTGGGALIKDLDRRICEETGLPVGIAEDPVTSVVLGIGQMLTDFKLLRRIAIE